ncbi:sensor histidine kinase [Collinsella aerofaciens]
MTALLTCAACVLTNCLVGYTGMRYMDAIGSDISAFTATSEDSPQAFDPTKATLDNEVTIVVNDAQESFGTTAWRITAGVTLLGGVLAYFVSGRALKPLRAFADQVERVQPDNLSEIRLSEDVPTELQRCSASFNDMIARLGEGFSAQRQFTGNAAHELRTPLALMQAQIELFVSERSNLQPETAELLGLLQEQTERMSRMTKVLLEMSELRSVPCEDDVELGPLSEEILTDLAPLAENKGIALNCAGNALVIGSDTLLYRLVFNLVENAIRYSHPGSTVNVSICDNDSHVFLRVEDQGPGIPKQYRESIFQPFFRLDKSRSRAYGGAGLGLALVWEIAALHGGTVEVETSSENGTTMLVSLPKRSVALTEQ